jgi:hypothetical protein
LKNRVGFFGWYPAPKAPDNRLPGQFDQQFCGLVLDHVSQDFAVHFLSPRLRLMVEADVAAVDYESITTIELHIVFGRKKSSRNMTAHECFDAHHFLMLPRIDAMALRKLKV